MREEEPEEGALAAFNFLRDEDDDSDEEDEDEGGEGGWEVQPLVTEVCVYSVCVWAHVFACVCHTV